MSDKVEVEIGVRNAPLKAGLDEANKWVQDWREEVASHFAGALAAGGLMAGIEGVIEYAKQVRNLSQQYGVSTTVIQQWGTALEMSGQEMTELAGVFNDLEIARSEAVGGDDEMRKNFQDLGVTIEELRDLGVDQIMMRIANGTMNAASMGKVMGEESVRLRPMLKALAEGSIELGDAMEEGTINALASTSDQIAKLKQEVTVGGGELLNWLGKVARSAVAAAEGVGVLATVTAIGLAGTAAVAIKGGAEEAKKFWQASIDEARAQFAGFREEIEATWNPESADGGGSAKIGRGDIGQSDKQLQQLDRESTLMERLMDLRRQAAMEEANDEEKMAQLLDREQELRLQAADLDESTTDGLEARIKVEEVVLKILQLQNQMADKAKQAREKEAQERKTQAEKFKRDQEAAEQRLRDEQDRVTVMQTEVSLGDEVAQRLSKQLEYANKIRDLEDKIVDARESGNMELAATLTRTQQLIRQQAQLASDPASQAFSKNGGRAPKVSDLRRQAEDRERQKKAQDKFRGRLVDGLIPTARDINGNPIEGIDPVTGERRKINPPAPAVDPFKNPDSRNKKPGELVGPPLPPGFDVNKPGQEKDPTGAKLDKINTTLTTIEKKLDKPLTHG